MNKTTELHAIMSEIDRLGVMTALLIDNGLTTTQIIQTFKKVVGYDLSLSTGFIITFYIKKIWGKKE